MRDPIEMMRWPFIVACVIALLCEIMAAITTVIGH